MKDKRRILFVVPSLARSGAESQVLDLVETLDDSAWRKYLVTFEPGLDQASRLERREVDFRPLRRWGAIDLRLALKVARLIDDEDIQVVHATLSIAVLVAWMGRMLSRRQPPLVAAIHTTLSRDRKNEVANWLVYRPILRRCQRVLFISHQQRSHWLRRLPGVEAHSGVVHNGIDVQRYIRGGDSVGGTDVPAPAPSGKIVACVAAFRPEKGHTVLLDAWQAVLKDHPDAVLYLVGAGPLQETVRKLVQERSLTGSVVFTGSVEDVRTVLAMARVTVLSSVAVETFSLAALESMAMEVPVVATNIGGMSEVVLDGRTGLLVPPNDVGELAGAICRVLTDEAWAAWMGQNARARVVEHFDRRVMARRTEEFLLDIFDDDMVFQDG